MGQSEVIEKLKEALQGAKAKLLEQKEVLDALTAQPRPQAVVVDFREGSFKTDAPFREYAEGVRVRVNAIRGTREEGIVGGFGTVTDDQLHLNNDDYDVTVTMEDSRKFHFGIGRSRKGWLKGKKLPCELDVVKPGAVIVNYQGQRLELEIPVGLTVRVGDTVTLSAKTLQVLDTVPDPGIGETVMVRQPVDTRHSEVDWQGGTRVVVHAHALGSVEKGDRVVLDPTAAVIVRNLGRGEERFLFEQETNVRWSDIGGLEHAKTELREAVELPYTEPDLYRFYGYPIPKGALLFGPPRCGKTMLGKAVATAIADAHGSSVATGFFYVKGSEILDKYVGVAEGLIRHLFNRGRHHKRVNGYPAVIFIDEADAIMYKRGTGISSDVERTIVPAFLAEMDGLEESGAVVILATNRADTLDPAIVGDGRIDRRIFVPRPDRAASLQIAQMHLRSVPFAKKKFTFGDAADVLVGELFGRERVLRELVVMNGTRQTVPFTLRDIRNGAMVVSAVNHARSIAMRRDRAEKTRQGVREGDLAGALDMLACEYLKLNHDDAIREVLDTMPTGTKLVDIKMPAGLCGTGGA